MKKRYRFLFNFIFKHAKDWIFISLIFNILLGFLPLASLWITENLVNEISKMISSKSGADFGPLLHLLFIQLIILLFSFSSGNITRLYDTHVAERLNYHLTKIVSIKAASVPLAYFDLPEFHHHHERIHGHLGERVLSPVKRIYAFVKESLTLFSLIGYLLSTHWGLSVLSMLAIVPTLIVQMRFSSQQFVMMKYQTPNARKANYFALLLNSREIAKEVRLFKLKDYFIQQWSKFYRKNMNEYLTLLRKQEYIQIGLYLLTSLLYVAAVVLVISLLRSTSLSIGAFVAILQSFERTQNSANSIAINVSQFYKDHLYITDLVGFLSFKEDKIIEYTGKTPFPHTLQKGIRFHNVSFKYPFSERPVLKDISFEIKSGEKVAIVGANGSGKTTLVKCLMGLYPVEKGQIYFDDIPITDMNRDDLYEKITCIFQDFVRFNLSVKENIAVGSISDINQLSKIQSASKKVEIHDLITSFPDQYDTVLGRVLMDGEDLSGGQWQKIGLARALVKEGEIYILDEPTAALDPLSELEVFEKFENLTSNKTTIFISHRMAAARLADRILVLKNGKLIEQGNHWDLISLNGEYANMYRMQAKWYE
ncbi:ABC transporter ATP-binding protein [Paenactinomyces guangxiensis]|uniref:ABC transporter ATP-binding protein n=1 Tax=Paenactinomyces guangxiensis TaxID=1490290 RepID=A0A7W1WV23_9BACL|nr:ABC transporter ATP-binding protein [Paenactinomyces guangxiensis]MBA4496467.1 ABC transporter ATP-binding protein [Paenactinomyces guangxiensis]MBH8593583.1 ABC transporter ATP-binding protein [Paenactinomyces guangxiensis]